MTDPGATVELVAASSPERTWRVLTPVDPSRFYPRFGPLPATTAVRDQSGPWNVVGQTRRLELSDGGHVIETITDVVPATPAEPVALFAYELTEFQKVFRHLVDHARAEWTFTPVPEGTRVRWTYRFVPRRGWRWLVALIVRLWWERYMRRVLPALVHEAERLA